MLTSAGAYRLAADEAQSIFGGDWALDKPSWFSGEICGEVSSAYITASGSVCDSRPIATQELDWRFNLGDYGWIDGYGWFVSSLHDKQHPEHRELFSEFEGACHYGYDFQLADGVALSPFAGMLWNPQIGYKHVTDRYWGEHFGASLKNPYVMPYVSVLTMHQPTPCARARIGVKRDFPLTDSITVTPFAETVWANHRRYLMRYGDDPVHGFIHGAFITTTSGLKVQWHITRNLAVYCRVRQFDTIDSHARRRVKDKTQYYSRRDLTVVAAGATYVF